MNCREFADVVLALARNQAAEARLPALSHTAECAACATRLEQERALWAGMCLVIEECAAQEAPASLEGRLLAAFHEQASAGSTASPWDILARWWSWRFVAATGAALLLIVLGILWQSAGGKEQPSEVKVTAPQPRVPTTRIVSKDNEEPLPTPTPQVAKRQPPARRHISPPRVVVPEEAPTPFYSLIEEGQMAPLESGRIVRIEVPAAALVKFGVPLTETTLAQPMQADLLLGQDGLARAIRFVPGSPQE